LLFDAGMVVVVSAVSTLYADNFSWWW